jgi:UDP-3-O-[3-hydroxymyristoyl] N-acetylglucosamine deacetylase / 3-hydroxyacyl-[acyl-carrier-protein] dehydratase
MNVGVLEQKANREFYVIDEPIHYQNKERQIDLAALPFSDFRITIMVDYNSPVLGIQHATMVRFEDFYKEIAPSRTFCFFHELKDLFKAGLIKGGNTDNAIVVIDQDVSHGELEDVAQLFKKREAPLELKAGILDNKALRFPNEPARHKLLDLIGDLTLIGSPLKAQILAARPGHASNIAFGRQVKRLIKQKKVIRKYQTADHVDYTFDIKAIQKILPHRYPFLLVDRIVRIEEKFIEGYKNVTINEPFFQGHFENNPIMPGVLILEALAQVGGVLYFQIVDNPEDYWVYLLGIDKARFKKPVTPGDQLVMRLEVISMKRNVCKMLGRAFVNDQLVCEAEMIASLVKRT